MNDYGSTAFRGTSFDVIYLMSDGIDEHVRDIDGLTVRSRISAPGSFGGRKNHGTHATAEALEIGEFQVPYGATFVSVWVAGIELNDIPECLAELSV